MAIYKENFEVNGRAMTRTYSDEYRYIVRDGISYIEAIDPSEFNRTYVEGNPIEIVDDDYAIVGQIIMGERDMDFGDDYETMQQEFINIGKMLIGVDENDNS
jgi:hypothetical protein